MKGASTSSLLRLQPPTLPTTRQLPTTPEKQPPTDSTTASLPLKTSTRNQIKKTVSHFRSSPFRKVPERQRQEEDIFQKCKDKLLNQNCFITEKTECRLFENTRRP